MGSLTPYRVLLWGSVWVVLLAQGGWAQEHPGHRRELIDRADSLRQAHQHERALDTYEQAIRDLGASGAPAARGYAHKEIGILHAIADRFEQALDHTDRAIRLYRAADQTAGLARCFNNRAVMQRRLGQYEEALSTYQKALAANRKVGDREDRAVMLNNVGIVHENLGEYREALQHYRRALDLNRALQSRTGIATSLDNIGDVFFVQGRYERALSHFQSALRIYRAQQETADAANALNGIGRVHLARWELDEARSNFREVLRMYRDLGDRSSVAATLNNIGVIQHRQGDHPAALATLRQALEINRDIQRRAGEAKNLNKIGAVRRAQGRYEQALARHRQALRINRTMGRPAGRATTQHHVGLTRLQQERFAAADSVLRASVRTTERLVETAEGDTRRDFLAKEMDRYQALITTRVRAERPAAALRAHERSRTRVLADRIAHRMGDSTRTVPAIDSLQSTIGPTEAAVLYANTDTERPITAFVVTRHAVRAFEIPDADLLRQVGRRYEAALERLRARAQVPWRAARASMLRQARGIRVGTETEGTLANLVRLYRHELSVPRAERLLTPERRTTLGQHLYSLLVAPIEGAVASRKTLVIVPDGALSYLPFETLSDWSGRSVIARWQVRYVQSLRVQYHLRARSRARTTQPRRALLAVGGVRYEAPTGEVGSRVLVARRSGRAGADQNGTGRREPGREEGPLPATVLSETGPEDGLHSTPTYRKYGYGPERWTNLQQTRAEVQALADLVGDATVLEGTEAREATLHRWSRTGKLDDYRVLHFATHGFVVPERPRHSALVLSEVGRAPGHAGRAASAATTEDRFVADGYLSMQEIPRLDLEATFVGLSACQTGLGRIYRGSGTVNLTQAFLWAGASSVAVSLWAVDDASTRRFMEGVYRRAGQPGTSWADAVAETKRAFATGAYGDRLQAPRFWAPFVFYGWEARAPH